MLVFGVMILLKMTPLLEPPVSQLKFVNHASKNGVEVGRSNGLFNTYYECWMGCGNMESISANMIQFVTIVAVTLLSLVMF